MVKGAGGKNWFFAAVPQMSGAVALTNISKCLVNERWFIEPMMMKNFRKDNRYVSYFRTEPSAAAL